VLSVPAVLANSSDMQWGLAGNMLAMRHGGNRLTVSAAHIGDVAASVVFCEQRDGNGASLWVPMSSSFDGRQISTGQRSKNIGIREYGRRALLEAASVIGDVALHMRTTMAEGGPYAPQVQLTRQSELA